LSEKVAVAVNCCVNPREIVGVTGAIAREVAVAEVTVNVVFPLIAPEVAVMVVVPGPAPRANPSVGAVLLIVATDESEEDQLTLAVMFCLLLSEYVPVAVN
jgi:hypothetical protein